MELKPNVVELRELTWRDAFSVSIFLVEISRMGSDVRGGEGEESGWGKGSTRLTEWGAGGLGWVRFDEWEGGGLWWRWRVQWNAGGGQRVVWFGCFTPLHIPLFLRNDRAVGLRDHVVGYLRFRVILESQSPLVKISALPLVHSEIGPLQVLGLGFKIALARLETSGAADLGGFLLVVRVIRVLQVLGDGRVSGQAAGLAVAVSEHVFLGAVVSLEGALAAAQEYEE